MSCSATTSSGSAARGMNPHSSSSRSSTIRSALSASGSSGSSPCDLAGLHASTSTSSSGTLGIGGVGEGEQAPVQPALLGPVELGGEHLVAVGLALELLLDQALHAVPVGRRERPGERLQRVDVDVGVAPLAERVGELLDVA